MPFVRILDSIFGGAAISIVVWLKLVAVCTPKDGGGSTCTTDFTTLPRASIALLGLVFLLGAALQNVFSHYRHESLFADMGGSVLSTVGGLWTALFIALFAAAAWQGGWASLDELTIWPAAVFGGVFGYLFWSNRPRAYGVA